MKLFNNAVKNNDVPVAGQRSYNFQDFDAVYVNGSDQYQQKDYNKILNSENKKDIDLWAWKNDKAVAEFAILCAEKDIP